MNILLVISMPVYLLIGIFIGKYHERLLWNILIDKGLIPKPDNDKKEKI